MGKVTIVADPGGTHGGSLEKMYALIDAAKAAGADVYKGQFVSSPARLAARRHAQEYEHAYRTISYDPAWHELLAARCASVGLEYMATCYLADDLPIVAPYVRRWKVASMEARDRDFLKAHLAYSKPMIVSTGGMSEGEVLGLAGWLAKRTPATSGYAILYCLSAYPAPPEEMNLGALDRRYHGLSDHSMSPVVAAMAVARGAAIIEAHLRLDDCDPKNPDYPHSMPPTRFAEYVQTVRLAEKIMGEGPKRVMPGEERWLRFAVRP